MLNEDRAAMEALRRIADTDVRISVIGASDAALFVRQLVSQARRRLQPPKPEDRAQRMVGRTIVRLK